MTSFEKLSLNRFCQFFVPVVLLSILAFNALSQSDEGNFQRVKIADPFINLHTGPGKAYPVFYVIDRGAMVSIEKRRTDWFRIRSDDGKTGWASREDMQLTLLPGGELFSIEDADESDFVQRRWSYGISGGEFEKSPAITVYSAYSLTENLAAEVGYIESSANFSSSRLIKVNLMMQPFPELSASPFFTLGVGQIKVSSSPTLISANRQQNTFAQIGLGMHYYLSRRFVLRFELNEYVIFSANNSNDENEDLGEWKTGFSIFF